MTLGLLHTSAAPHLPVSLNVAFALLALGALVFGLILYDIAKRYELPTSRSGEPWR